VLGDATQNLFEVMGLVLRLLRNVYKRTTREAIFEVGENLIEPRDALVDVEISDVIENAIVDNEEAFRPRVVL